MILERIRLIEKALLPYSTAIHNNMLVAHYFWSLTLNSKLTEVRTVFRSIGDETSMGY